jgi:ABC-type amino acid transport substrate-binding protein
LAAVAVPDARAQQADSLAVLTEEFPPYNFTEDGELRGIATDILKLVLEDAKVDVRGGPMQVYPWARAYNVALVQPDTMLYSVTRTAEREKLFKWVGPVASNRNVLLARKDRSVKIATLKDAGKFKAGAIRDDAGGQLLVAGGYPPDQMELSSDARSNILKLETGRIDLFAYPENVFKWMLATMGKNPGDYETVFVLHDGHVYFALNRDTPDELVANLQKSLDKVKASGQAQAIIDGYLKGSAGK